MGTKEEKINKSWLEIIGFLLIFFGLCLIIHHFVSNRKLSKQEQNALKKFYIQNQELIDNGEPTEESLDEKEVKEQYEINYIAVLKIPKINLERGLVEPNSYLNNVDYNVQILDNSDMPNIENGNLILAAHSGNSRVSYFKDLDKLIIGDKVLVDYNGRIYNYKVINIYDIEKTGTANIIKNKDTSTLTLITCRNNTNKQIIIICELDY